MMGTRMIAAGSVLVLAIAAPPWSLAHCDTLDGPVVMDARIALQARQVDPVLKWVKPEAEAEVRAAFTQASAVRVLGPEAEALADRFFFETVVRLHRQGEGEAYTGLEPAGTPLDPAVAAADQALETGSPEALLRLISTDVDHGLRERFARAAAARRHAKESAALGRAYVAAYVEFVHYAERLRVDASSSAGHDEPGRADREH
jgi:uncharacterized protein DUF6448